MLQNIMHRLIRTILMRTESKRLVACNLLALNLKTCLDTFFSGQMQLYFLTPPCEPTFIDVLVSKEVGKAYKLKSQSQFISIKTITVTTVRVSVNKLQISKQNSKRKISALNVPELWGFTDNEKALWDFIGDNICTNFLILFFLLSFSSSCLPLSPLFLVLVSSLFLV